MEKPPRAALEVGSLEGESLARHIALAIIDQGANGVFATDGTEGETYYFPSTPVLGDGDDNEDWRRKFLGN